MKGTPTVTLSGQMSGVDFMRNPMSWLKMTLIQMNDAKLFGRFTAIIVTLALIVRLGMLLCFWPTWIWHTAHVQDSWNDLAINWVTHGTFGFNPDEPTIARGPVFPLLE